MTTHIGKIGRLSKDRRAELGRRLEDGVPGTEIIHWLNALPDVQKVLAQYFAGRPILEQNLSDWKQSGHLAWVRQQAAQAAAQGFMESADDLEQLSRAAADRWTEWAADPSDLPPERRLSDRYAVVMTAEIYRLGMELLAEEPALEKRWQRLRELNRELSTLRRDDHRLARQDLRRKQVERELDRQAQEAEQREEQEHKARLTSAVMAPLYRGIDEEVVGAKGAELLYRIKYDLPMDDIFDGTWEAKRAEAMAKAQSEKRKSGNGAAKPQGRKQPADKPVAPTGTSPIPSPLRGERVRVRGARTFKGHPSKPKNSQNNPAKTPVKSPKSRLIKPNKTTCFQSPIPRQTPSTEIVAVAPQPNVTQPPTPQPEPMSDTILPTDPEPQSVPAPVSPAEELDPLAEAHRVRDQMTYGKIPYDGMELARLFNRAYGVK